MFAAVLEPIARNFRVRTCVPLNPRKYAVQGTRVKRVLVELRLRRPKRDDVKLKCVRPCTYVCVCVCHCGSFFFLSLFLSFFYDITFSLCVFERSDSGWYSWYRRRTSVAMGAEYSIDCNARGDSEQSALQNVHLKRWKSNLAQGLPQRCGDVLRIRHHTPRAPAEF